MKRISFLTILLCSASIILLAQKPKLTYPEPEFSKEIYGYKMSGNELVRLEKETSAMKSKAKMGGFGGAESGYEISGSKSSVRFRGTDDLTFVFQSGYAKNEKNSGKDNARDIEDADSAGMNMMDANNLGEGMGDVGSVMDMLNDPARAISLYAVTVKNGNRKIVLQDSPGGMMGFAKKDKGNTKYSLSFKKVKDSYFEIVVDKILPKGEYVFINTGQQNSMDYSAVIFAFAID